MDELLDYFEKSGQSAGDSPSALVVTRRGEILVERYEPGVYRDQPFGPVDEKALWPIFSITKSYAMGAILMLCEEGMLTLDDPVSSYLPGFSTHGEGAFDRRHVTIRHLASQTSGVSIPKEKYTPRRGGPPPDPELVQIGTEPSKTFLYHALGTHLLEVAIASATGEDFASLLQERILDPLGLNDTRYRYSFDHDLPMIPPSLEFPDQPGMNQGVAFPGLHCTTGLWATARDVNRYGQFWASAGEYEGTRLFSDWLKSEVWRHHATQEDNGARYGLLWWLPDKEGAYIMSGSHRQITVVVPESGVVVTVVKVLMTSPTWPEGGGDKEILAEAALRLGC